METTVEDNYQEEITITMIQQMMKLTVIAVTMITRIEDDDDIQ